MNLSSMRENYYVRWLGAFLSIVAAVVCLTGLVVVIAYYPWVLLVGAVALVGYAAKLMVDADESG